MTYQDDKGKQIRDLASDLARADGRAGWSGDRDFGMAERILSGDAWPFDLVLLGRIPLS